LSDAGLAVIGVADHRVSEMDGRVKTLHPKIHGGILARRDHPDDLAAAAAHGIGMIDLVVVNLYPFAATAKKPGVTFDELIENIDIGGPSMVRAAAKNFRDVLVVVDPSDYPRLLAAIDETPGPAFRVELMVKAFAHTGEYDTTITATLRQARIDGDRPARAAGLDDAPTRPTGSLPDRVDLALEKIKDLRYGENPHQQAAWYRPAGVAQGAQGAGLGGATILQGKELSYTNLLDLDAAARIVLEFDEPAAVVVKHTNPCGAATGRSAADAYLRARDADRVAAFGGIVALNRPIDAATAEAIVSTFIEAVIAPSVDAAAQPILANKTNMRVVTAGFEAMRTAVEMRSILGAMLSQERDPSPSARGVDTGVAARRLASSPPASRRPRSGGAALRVADRRAREVERGDLHRRARTPRLAPVR
jgi:phosphoribosylaminoimidazolecarboxamide formyltransferase/IMP cyclohydrolase